MDYICIGTVINTHGIKGELKIRSCSDFDEDRYCIGNTVYLKTNEGYKSFVTASFRIHKGYSLVSFEGYEDINLIEKYKGCSVYIDRNDQAALPEGEYYMSQMIGLKVLDESGTQIGTVINVEETNGAQNNLRIQKNDGNSILLPNVPAFVKKVDLKEKSITVMLIEGML